ncbi:MAG: hypothetical protein K9N48_05185 [Verrucomicrobia bacterium]|nr:hypothetical protein [Verrucomicrobiota bacterium]MCF7708648.1 hypothetical protein [Verrucomicrobiota bacterium]
MSEPKSTSAWQPLTFGGVAAFGRSSFARLLTFEAVAGCIAAVIILWSADKALLPAFEEAITKIPAEGAVRNGRLNWHVNVPEKLGTGKFAAILYLEDAQVNTGHVADFQMEILRDGIRLRSLPGTMYLSYPNGWIIEFNRTFLEPWWGAWSPVVYLGIFFISLLLLMAAWTLLGFIYAFPLRFLIFFYDRNIDFAGTCKLATAAQFPGAIVMCTGIVLYTLQHINIFGLLIFTATHFCLPWIYMIVSPLFLQRVSASIGLNTNPFASRMKEIDPDEKGLPRES